MAHPNRRKKTDHTFSRQQLASFFIGSIIKKGQKQKARSFFSKVISNVRKIYRVDGIKFIHILLESARPKVFLTSKKIAGVIYKIPTPISRAKSYAIVIRWITAFARKRKSTSFSNSLFEELSDIYKNPSNNVLKRRDEFHKLAYINKPFLRYYKFLNGFIFFF